jgi:hypothetical protein
VPWRRRAGREQVQAHHDDPGIDQHGHGRDQRVEAADRPAELTAESLIAGR